MEVLYWIGEVLLFVVPFVLIILLVFMLIADAKDPTFYIMSKRELKKTHYWPAFQRARKEYKDMRKQWRRRRRLRFKK